MRKVSKPISQQLPVLVNPKVSGPPPRVSVELEGALAGGSWGQGQWILADMV